MVWPTSARGQASTAATTSLKILGACNDHSGGGAASHNRCRKAHTDRTIEDFDGTTNYSSVDKIDVQVGPIVGLVSPEGRRTAQTRRVRRLRQPDSDGALPDPGEALPSMHGDRLAVDQ